MPYGKSGIFPQVSIHMLWMCTKITKIKTSFCEKCVDVMHLKGPLEPQLAYAQNSLMVMVTALLHDGRNLLTLQTFRSASSLFA
jgi:hypothetical protein